MVSNYPSQIDGYSQIRVVRNRIDEIIAKDHNDLRSAVIALEQTLGINPQGIFGTVVGRLEDVDTTTSLLGTLITEHAAGTQLRHDDSHIDSVLRNGSPYSLSLGTVSTQLTEILSHLNSFVNQLDSSIGGTMVGSTGFSSNPDSKYSFSGTDIQAQIEESGDFLNENANYLQESFDSFVSSGMAVTQSGSGPNAAVASGYIASNGRLLRYSGGTVSVSVVPGTYYIYATISSGAVSVSSATLAGLPFSTTNTIVLLHKIEHSGSTWTSNTDLRRFGLLVNNKNYFTVGGTPSSGSDGYGCDFTSIKSAIEYIKAIDNSNVLIAPKKIILINDISISDAAEMSITLDVEGIEIDGSGRKISTTVDSLLFSIEQDNITIKDVVLESNLTSSGSSLCLASMGNSTSVSNIEISNCKVTRGGSHAAPYFLRCGNALSTTTVNYMNVFGNIAEISVAAINLQKTIGSALRVVNKSIISNNIFLQNSSSASWAASGESCIRVGDFCIVEGNVIEGGFDIGVEFDYGHSSIVLNNIINGGTGVFGTSGSPTMQTGISVKAPTSYKNSHCLVEGNVIKGIINYGVRIVSESEDIFITGNYIDNSFDPISSMIGILCHSSRTFVNNNVIYAPGSYGIDNASFAIGNTIIGDLSLSSLTAAIQAPVDGYDGIINDNSIINCAGRGIDLNGSDNFIVNGNLLDGYDTSSSAITFVGSSCVISDNLIKEYGGSGASAGIMTMSDAYNILIANNIISEPRSNMSWGIDLNDGYSLVIGNVLGSEVFGMPIIGIDVNNSSGCFVSNNTIYGEALGASSLTHSIANVGVGCVINNNRIVKANYYGIELQGSNTICSNNIITYPAHRGINAENADEIQIINNYILNTDYEGIIINNCKDSIISNNFLKSIDVSGITLTTGSDYGLVSGNYVSDLIGSGTRGIQLISSNGINVTNNFIKNGDTDSVGISCSSVIGASFVGNHIEDFMFGLMLSSDCFACGNYFKGSGGGVGITVNLNSTGCFITGNKVDTASNGILTNLGCANTKVCNNWLENITSTGLVLNSNSPNGMVVGNYLLNIGTTSGSAIYLGGGCRETIINDNYIYSAGTSGIVINALSHQCNVVGNYIHEVGNYGIYLNDAYSSNVSSNIIYESTNDGINLSGQMSNSVIQGNNILNSSASGIYCSSHLSNGIKICSNNVYDSDSYGIFNSSSGNTISDNCIRVCVEAGLGLSGNKMLVANNKIWGSTGSSGIYVFANGTDSIISNNLVDGVDSYGILLNDGAIRSNICGNIVQNADWGINTEGADKVILSSNSIYDIVNVALAITGTDCIVMGNRVISGVGYSLNANGATGTLIIGNWFDTDDISYGTDYLVIGNMCEGGTPAGWSGPPAGEVIAGTNYQAHS